MSGAPSSSRGGIGDSEYVRPTAEVREEFYIPIAVINRVMKQALPHDVELAKDAKDRMQEFVTELICYLTSTAVDKVRGKNRNVIYGDDMLWSLKRSGFVDYAILMRIYMQRYRQFLNDEVHSTDAQIPLQDSILEGADSLQSYIFEKEGPIMQDVNNTSLQTFSQDPSMQDMKNPNSQISLPVSFLQGVNDLSSENYIKDLFRQDVNDPISLNISKIFSGKM